MAQCGNCGIEVSGRFCSSCGGAVEIDSFATRMLSAVVHMLKLRGAETVIVGIQPDVAFAVRANEGCA